jgi:hypothetical protein
MIPKSQAFLQCHFQSDIAKMPTMVTVFVIALAFLVGTTKIGLFCSLPHHPKKPKQAKMLPPSLAFLK